MTIAAAVLLIATANLTGIVMARGVMRAQELAVRRALVDIQYGRADDTFGWMHRIC